ncbi:MAG: acyltransferase [Candidatus Magasanikbacteria bacterium]|nr:acyltransferase [Candidatus Magasanikbacteria bacterium]
MITKRQAVRSAQYNKRLLKAVGADVFISHAVEIRRPQLVRLGSHIAIDTGFYLTTAAELGDYIHIGPDVCIIGGARGLLKMGNFTNLAAGCRVICVSDTFTGEGLITAPGIPPEYCRLKIAPVVLEDFANVGANAVIMPGVTLGKGSVVGACSLVTHNTEPWTIYAGIPARPIKKRPRAKMLRFARALGY